MGAVPAAWAVGGGGYFWPGWVILIGGLIIGGRARRLFRSDPLE